LFNRFLIWTGILRPVESFADIILNNRRTKSLAIATSTLALISIGINYAMWIYPVFEDPDFGNTAVRNYLSSDFYKTESENAARQLELYNEGKTSGRAIDLKFFYPFRGVMVKHEMNLVPREEKRPDGGKQYKFENSFKVSLNLLDLMLFILLLGGLLAFGVFVILSQPPRELVEHEESMLKSLFSTLDKNSPTITLESSDCFTLVEKSARDFISSLSNYNLVMEVAKV